MSDEAAARVKDLKDGLRAVKRDVDARAKRDGSNLTPEEAQAFASKIGAGGGGGAPVDAYTKSETDQKLGLKANQTALEALQLDKASKSTVYTRDEVDGKFEALPEFPDIPEPPEVPTKATAAELLTGTDDAKFATAKGLADAVGYVSITTAASGLNLSSFVNGLISLTANLTVGAPSGGYPGQAIRLRFVQDATGGRTVAWHANYILPTGFAIQATANGVTEVPGVREADGKVRLFMPSKWVA